MAKQARVSVTGTFFQVVQSKAAAYLKGAPYLSPLYRVGSRIDDPQLT
jgi:hypothetical protein